MTLSIHIPSSQAIEPEVHNHFCVVCRKSIDEPNTVCQKSLRGSGLSQHTFVCMNHIAWYRQNYGIEDLLDVYLNAEQARRFVHEWKDERVEQREKASDNPDLAVVHAEPQNQGATEAFAVTEEFNAPPSEDIAVEPLEFEDIG